MKERSVQKNAALNVIKELITEVCLLVTAVYRTRALGKTALGQYSFAASLAAVFTSLAALGVRPYATREGAKLRGDRAGFERFAGTMRTIHLAASFAALSLLFAGVTLVPRLRETAVLIMILSIPIAAAPFAAEWVFAVFEDYLFLSLQVILTNLAFTALMFLTVHSPEDLYRFALLSAVTTSAAALADVIYGRKYVRFRLGLEAGWERHVKPLLTLLSKDMAISVYVRSDMIFLGFMAGDAPLGLYSLSVSIYSTVKHLLNAVLAVTLSRLTILSIREDRGGYRELCGKLFQSVMLLTVPALTGLFLLSDCTVRLIGGEAFAGSAFSLRILCAALLPSLAASFSDTAVLLVHGEERRILRNTCAAALCNILLNFVCVPLWQEAGAALTTLISEIIVAGLSLRASGKYLSFKGYAKVYAYAGAGCLWILLVNGMIRRLAAPMFLQTALIILLGTIGYFAVLWGMRNPLVCEMAAKLRKGVSK